MNFLQTLCIGLVLTSTSSAPKLNSSRTQFTLKRLVDGEDCATSWICPFEDMIGLLSGSAAIFNQPLLTKILFEKISGPWQAAPNRQSWLCSLHNTSTYNKLTGLFMFHRLPIMTMYIHSGKFLLYTKTERLFWLQSFGLEKLYIVRWMGQIFLIRHSHARFSWR